MGYDGKPYFLMDDLGVPLFSETSVWSLGAADPLFLTTVFYLPDRQARSVETRPSAGKVLLAHVFGV